MAEPVVNGAGVMTGVRRGEAATCGSEPGKGSPIFASTRKRGLQLQQRDTIT